MAALSVHHVGVAVDDLEQAVRTWVELFGAAVEHRERLDEQGVEAVSLRTGSGRVELLAPLGPDTPVGRFLAKRGPGMHHIAFEVADVAVELERLGREGAQLIDEQPRRGLFGMQVAFVHPEATGGVLAELVADDRT
jgi:methylmalonyl-CoA/ethylmalonyl-CoA epimerase